MSGNEKIDIFISNNVFPKPENIFKTPRRNLEDIKNDCIVVLDTNVLLLPFTLNSKSLLEIKDVFQSLVAEGRLFVPAQVVREFAKNRPGKLTDVYQKLSRTRNSTPNLTFGNYPLLSTLEEYNQLREVEKEINEKIKEYRKIAGSLLEKMTEWVWDDPVSLIYNDIFRPEIIVELEKDDETERDTLTQELDRLILHKLPPGYKDASKSDKGIGDFLIWKTILQIAEKEKKDLIFVTGDTKADWWYQSEKVNLYPRYELVDEYRRASDDKLFHMVSLSKLLELQDANEEIIDDIRHQEVKNTSRKFCLNVSDDDYAPLPCLVCGKDILSDNLINNSVAQIHKDSDGDIEYLYGCKGCIGKYDDIGFIEVSQSLYLEQLNGWIRYVDDLLEKYISSKDFYKNKSKFEGAIQQKTFPSTEKWM